MFLKKLFLLIGILSFSEVICAEKAVDKNEDVLELRSVLKERNEEIVDAIARAVRYYDDATSAAMMKEFSNAGHKLDVQLPEWTEGRYKAPTVLMLALKLGKMKTARYLIQQGADVNQHCSVPGYGHITPLVTAINAGIPEAVQLCIDAGAKLSEVGSKTGNYELGCNYGNIWRAMSIINDGDNVLNLTGDQKTEWEQKLENHIKIQKILTTAIVTKTLQQEFLFLVL